MARAIPPDRFGQLVDVATRTFIARGYRLTQMADIAEALGVAKGTVYGYVESKEALFDAALRYADGHVKLPAVSDLPLRTPAAGDTAHYVRERLAAEAIDLVLARVVAGTLVIDEPRRELESVLSDLYERMARNRVAIKLVDKCAADYPELAEAWFGAGRWQQHELLVRLIASGKQRPRFRRVAAPDIVARTILETLAFWSVHRHFDPSPQLVTDEEAKRAVVDLVSHGLLGAP